MDTAKIFTTGRSQAVRLPKEYRFDATEVMIKKVGDVVMLYPRGKEWDIMLDALSRFTPDFPPDRNQPKHVDRRRKL